MTPPLRILCRERDRGRHLIAATTAGAAAAAAALATVFGMALDPNTPGEATERAAVTTTAVSTHAVTTAGVPGQEAALHARAGLGQSWPTSAAVVAATAAATASPRASVATPTGRRAARR